MEAKPFLEVYIHICNSGTKSSCMKFCKKVYLFTQVNFGLYDTTMSYDKNRENGIKPCFSCLTTSLVNRPLRGVYLLLVFIGSRGSKNLSKDMRTWPSICFLADENFLLRRRRRQDAQQPGLAVPMGQRSEVAVLQRASANRPQAAAEVSSRGQILQNMFNL
jgi:hypothetical protein